MLLLPYSCAYGSSMLDAIFLVIASLSVVDDETVDDDSVCVFGCLCCKFNVDAVSGSVSFGG